MQPTSDQFAPGVAPGTWEELAGTPVLIVDDEFVVRELMRQWLQEGGCRVAAASSADQALSVMSNAPAAVVLCDVQMPGHDGLWLASRVRRQHPETAVVMSTGLQDVAPVVESLRQGVVDYLIKPFGRSRLREAVACGLQWHLGARAARARFQVLEREVQTRQARLADAIASMRVDSDDALDALLVRLTVDDPDAYAHAYRVAALSVSVARTLELTDTQVTTVERGALLHDVGKLAMPEGLLRKAAPLTRDEQRLIRLHPVIGSELIGGIPYLADAAAVVHDAHERPDGLGFPSGSRHDEAWIGARIVSVTDAYDTMVRPWLFGEAVSQADALLELERCSGTQFDPRVVKAFKRIGV